MKIKLFSLLALIIASSNVNGQTLSKTQITDITSHIGNLIMSNHVVKKDRQQIVDLFNFKIKSGKYYAINDPDNFAKTVSADLREISNDGHLYIEYSGNASRTSDNNKLWEKEELKREKLLNYGFREVQILENNIGYIKIVEFMHPKRSMQTAIATMKLVENTSALIVDLRGNGGGYPGIMEYILSHYFEGEPILLSTTYFSDKTKNPVTTYSSDLIYGKLRVNNPLYILIDKKTASASEYFAYVLQAHKKAKIVGENSAGGANRNTYFSLPENFRISISTTVPIIEITKSNWEHKGVAPDYIVKSEDAKAKAIDLINTNDL
ncbi:S41 family peptidase [Pedobacter sp.]|uniref:S41 family peptidase n=1 Tax=Pedobacter sp. TaxID=1411316 RepID=UPI003D7FFE23